MSEVSINRDEVVLTIDIDVFYAIINGLRDHGCVNCQVVAIGLMEQRHEALKKYYEPRVGDDVVTQGGASGVVIGLAENYVDIDFSVARNASSTKSIRRDLVKVVGR